MMVKIGGVRLSHQLQETFPRDLMVTLGLMEGSCSGQWFCSEAAGFLSPPALRVDFAAGERVTELVLFHEM